MPKVSVKIRRPVSAPIPITPPALGGAAPLEKPNFVGGAPISEKRHIWPLMGYHLLTGYGPGRRAIQYESVAQQLNMPFYSYRIDEAQTRFVAYLAQTLPVA